MTDKNIWTTLSGFEQKLGSLIYIARKEKSEWVDELNQLEGEIRALRRLVGKKVGKN